MAAESNKIPCLFLLLFLLVWLGSSQPTVSHKDCQRLTDVMPSEILAQLGLTAETYSSSCPTGTVCEDAPKTTEYPGELKARYAENESTSALRSKYPDSRSVEHLLYTFRKPELCPGETAGIVVAGCVTLVGLIIVGNRLAGRPWCW